MDQAEIAAIREWTYSGEDQSMLYPFVYKYVVEPLEYLIPTDTSPNSITVCGFGFIVTSTIYCVFCAGRDISFWETGLLAFSVIVYFIFDALDGVQGRRWIARGQDVYVLTQLYDHGFDSLTSHCNVFIFATVLRLSNLEQLVLFVIVSATFAQSALHYAIHRHMVFGFIDNPTEVVFASAVVIFVSPWLPNQLIHLLFPIFAAAMITILAHKFYSELIVKASGVDQKLDVAFFGVFYLVAVVLVPHAIFYRVGAQSIISEIEPIRFQLYLFLASLQHHTAVINVIMQEIVQKSSWFKNFPILWPQLFLLLLCLAFPAGFLHHYLPQFLSILIVATAGGALFAWSQSSGKICKALRMPYFWSFPDQCDKF